MDELLTWIIGLFLLIYGAALTFFGYRQFRFLIPVWAFIAGFWIGEAVIALIFPPDNAWIIIGWLVGLIAGLGIAALAFISLQAAFIILGATFGWWIASGLLAGFNIDQGLVNSILIILAAVLFAGLTFVDSIRRYVVSAYTALVGAGGIASGLLFLLGDLTAETFRNSFTTMAFIWEESGLVTLLWILLAVVGTIVQVVTTSEKGDEEEDQESADDFDDEEWLTQPPSEEEELTEEVPEEMSDEQAEVDDVPETLAAGAALQDESMADELLQEPLDDEEMFPESYLDEDVAPEKPDDEIDDLYLSGKSDV
jgi:hypothetical protein